MKAETTMFGNTWEYPVIKPLVEILNEEENNNKLTYCITTCQEFRVLMNSLTSLDKKLRKYVMRLILDDFLENRLEDSSLTDPLKSHLSNLITAIHNRKVKAHITRK